MLQIIGIMAFLWADHVAEEPNAVINRSVQMMMLVKDSKNRRTKWFRQEE